MNDKLDEAIKIALTIVAIIIVSFSLSVMGIISTALFVSSIIGFINQ